MTKKFFALFAIFIVSFSLFSKEGMWPLPSIPEDIRTEMETMGCTLQPEAIYSEDAPALKDLLVYLSNGYTGTLLSKEGLIMVPYDAVAQFIKASPEVSAEHGFYATEKYFEVPINKLSVQFVRKTENITWKIRPKLSEFAGDKVLKREIDSISSIILRDLSIPAGSKASIEQTNQGEFFLYVYDRYADIRLSYAPPESIALYGEKNAAWDLNRHNANFALLRIYADADNNPAFPNDVNRPASFDNSATIAKNQYNEEDFVFTLGFPNTSYRSISAAELKEKLFIKDSIDIFCKNHYANYWFNTNLEQYKKNEAHIAERKKIKGYIQKQQIIAKKETREADFTQWAVNNADFKTSMRFGNAIPLLNRTFQEKAEASKNFYLFSGMFENIELLRLTKLFRSINEKNKDDLFLEISKIYGMYDAEREKKTLIETIKFYRSKVDSTLLPTFYQEIDGKKFKGDEVKYVNYLFKKSFLASELKFNKYLDKPTDQVFNADPLIKLSKSIEDQRIKLFYAYYAYNENTLKCIRLYNEGCIEREKSINAAPDADFSLRLSYGNITSYSPSDGISIEYVAHFKGIFEQTYASEFIYGIDKKLKQLYDNKSYLDYATPEGLLRLNFMTDCDIIPTRLGEAVFNAYGELIGMLTSGNAASICSKYEYDARYQRSMALDINYALFLLDHYSNATSLLEELHFGEIREEEEPKVEEEEIEIKYLDPNIDYSLLYPTDSTRQITNDTLVVDSATIEKVLVDEALQPDASNTHVDILHQDSLKGISSLSDAEEKKWLEKDSLALDSLVLSL